ncbi:MAG: cytochrome P450 [Sulfuricaulis sp.]|uniref:cytochrome P450 n=1 Tax=Sulfuricaulis sp. TaxID=2003553 RepID=UPI003C4DB5F5
MTEAIALEPRTANLPPQVALPKAIQAIGFVLWRRWTIRQAARRYGDAFTLDAPVFGRTVVVADPALVKQVFMASTDDLLNIQPNLSRVLGPGSIFALDRAEHRNRRKLLHPPFHGKSIKNYEHIVEEETLREAANWPEGKEFRTLEPMMRITLNVILRAVFGAEGAELEYLRKLIPGGVKLGSRLATLPQPSRSYGRYSPWGRLAESHRKFDEIVDTLIAKAEADPRFDERTDILALMLRSRYDDGSPMSRREISDELLTLVAAGHETTASTLAWAFERMRRHPDLVAALTTEAEGDGNELRQATILEVQRARTVIDFAGRHVAAPMFELGEWRIPQGYSIVVSISRLHENSFADPDRFDPYRFVGNRPPTFAWVPFGGGTRRCIGAAFANTEMDVVLRTVLRQFTIDSTTDSGEKVHSRGVAYTPKRGGRVVLRRR